MNILINDANILIDLAELNLLDSFASLSFELYTTDFVLNEINNKTQRDKLNEYIKVDKLVIIRTENIIDYRGISMLKSQNRGLSIEVCSVWYYAKIMNAILITGDALLRKQAQNSSVEVRGIIFVFDQLVSQNLLEKSYAAMKLKELRKLNPRLPLAEIEKRIILWRKNI